MSAQRHRIRRQIFEVTVEDSSAAWRVQTELARIQSQRLGAILDRCLSELSTPERLVRIDSLEVDLGPLDPDNLEQDLVEKLGPALRAALLQRIEQDRQDDALTGEDPAVRSQLELVAFFARTGNLPWWADTSRPRPVDDAVARLLLRGRAALAALVRTLLRERGLLRLVLHTADARVVELAGLLLPRAHAGLESVLAAQATLLRELLPKAATPPLGVAVWRGALALALVQAASSPTAGCEGPETLIQDVLARTAGAAGLPLRALVSGLQARLQAPAGEPRSGSRETLAAIVERLAATPAVRLVRVQERAGTQPRSTTEAREREAHERERVAASRSEPPEAAADLAAPEVDGATAVLPDDPAHAAAREDRRDAPQDAAHAASGAPRRERDDPASTVRPDASRDLAPDATSDVKSDATPDATGAAPIAAPIAAAGAATLAAEADARGGAADAPLRHAPLGPLSNSRALRAAPDPARSVARGDAASDASGHAAGSARAAAASSAAARPTADIGQQAEGSAAAPEAAGRADGAVACAASASSSALRPPPEAGEAEVDELLARLTPLAGPLQPLLVELQAAAARAPEIKAALLQPLQLLEVYIKRGSGPGPAPQLVLQRLLGPLLRRGLVSPPGPGREPAAQGTEPAAPPGEVASAPPPLGVETAGQPDGAQRAVAAWTPAEAPQTSLPAARAPRAAAPERAPAPPAAAALPPAAPGIPEAALVSPRPVTDRAAAAETPSWAARSPRPVPLGFSESDALYVDNAGLVLLWPFLGRFFARLGLQEEGQWRDRAALHRAVGLLQHIATGELEPQEHQLALAKVLCGLPADEVFVFGEPVTAAEAEEATGLIGAVLVNAPALAELSVSELRGAFLNRPGALAVRSGSWLLRVERADQDAVLEQLPWGLGWVALPWLGQALCIEW
ncbi:MAG: contractile injection system tape measure protein [Polyangia bacterium]